ncbi:MAG TPA: glycosyltransferase family 4 protein, partial [Chthonomonadales bacterium]|nr:glycosyltransferase family 4 protein [Chthonomonadales bacterium]
NNFAELAGPPVLVTSDSIPTVKPEIETHIISPEAHYWDFTQLPSIAYTSTVASGALQLVDAGAAGFLYQRYSLDNYAGVILSRKLNIPLVLEYNSSEIWTSKHWSQRLKYEALSERIELLNLRSADLVVVVSKALKDQLTARGISDERILVNPNGVDPERYSPEADGCEVRRRLGLEDAVVIGFIGTFGRWHGADVLAEAFGRMLEECPEYRKRLRLMLIGDGVQRSATASTLQNKGVVNQAIFTGLIPQEEGPAYLAAADILVAPHVPNPDGTPFFGSPTKLFEYMAMGKGIVASRLDQIGEVLTHDVNAWLVEPASAGALADGLKVLVDRPETAKRLGAAARAAALQRHTWRTHTAAIVSALRERCG